jgi:hypothetical protein
MHAQWSILLDDEFLEAYAHGIVIMCCDGIMRRFYPRILTYSADYQEKYVAFHLVYFAKLVLIKYRVILASILSKGLCPCPRCLIPLSRFQNLGMIRDMKQRETLARVDEKHTIDVAREIIYQKKFAVDSKYVKNLLKGRSLAPTAVSAILVHQEIDFCQDTCLLPLTVLSIS